MPKFRVIVEETAVIHKEYHVEAPDTAAALEVAEFMAVEGTERDGWDAHSFQRETYIKEQVSA